MSNIHQRLRFLTLDIQFSLRISLYQWLSMHAGFAVCARLWHVYARPVQVFLSVHCLRWVTAWSRSNNWFEQLPILRSSPDRSIQKRGIKADHPTSRGNFPLKKRLFFVDHNYIIYLGQEDFFTGTKTREAKLVKWRLQFFFPLTICSPASPIKQPRVHQDGLASVYGRPQELLYEVCRLWRGNAFLNKLFFHWEGQEVSPICSSCYFRRIFFAHSQSWRVCRRRTTSDTSATGGEGERRIALKGFMLLSLLQGRHVITKCTSFWLCFSW